MPKCKYCGQEILLIEGPNRRRTPVNPELVQFMRINTQSDAYDRYVLPTGELVYGRPLKRFEVERTMGYIPHKYTCEGRDIEYKNERGKRR